MLIISVLFVGCATVPGRLSSAKPIESAIPGVPVPAGSQEQGLFDDGSGVVMAFYAHPRLRGGQILRFYETQMPAWGWVPASGRAEHPRQRSFERDGVPVLVGVDEADASEVGGRFSILRGARGDWGFMPQLREPQ